MREKTQNTKQRKKKNFFLAILIFFLEKKIKNSGKSSEVVSFFLIRKMITREKNVLARGQIKSKNRESFFSLKMSRTIYFEIIVTMGNKKNILFSSSSSSFLFLPQKS